MSLFAAIITLFHPQTHTQPIRIDLDTIPTVYHKRHNVNLTPLHKTGLSHVQTSYLGFKGEIPHARVIDWNANIRSMWQFKAHMPNVAPSARKSATSVAYSYTSHPAEQITLSSHIHALDRHLKAVQHDMDWQGICVAYRMTPASCEAFKAASRNIDARMMTAYSMTELMPYHNGIQNYQLMDLYMRTAGRNYLDVVPSMGDKLMSMGRYQFTSYAIGVDETGLRPSNFISKFAGRYTIPQSVNRLHGLDSDRAAYFLAVYNVAYLFRGMSDKQVSAYVRYCAPHKDQLTAYIATAHHMPRLARDNALSWVAGGCKKPLMAYQGRNLKTYATKTSVNYQEVLHHD